MNGHEETTADVLGSVWVVTHDHPLDEDCNPNKACRNMKDITFDGYAEPGNDLGAAWREKLAREGKLSTSAESIHDLTFGKPE